MPIAELGISNPTKEAGVQSTHLRQFYISSTTNSASAMVQLRGATPTGVSVAGLVLSHIERDVNPLGNGSTDWLGTVRYSHESSERAKRQSEPYQDGEVEEKYSGTFAGTLQQTKILVALSQTNYLKPDADAPDPGLAINIQHDGPPKGVDILVPIGSYKRKVVKKMPTFSAEKADELLGTKSAGPLFGKYEQGEALFTSYEAQKRGELWHINYGWSISRNKNDFPNLVDAGIITAPNDIFKEGWDYLWPLYAPGEDGAAFRPVPELIAVYVAQVYDAEDHLDLPGL